MASSNSPRRFAPWLWAIPLLPAALVVGWLVGGMPVPERTGVLPAAAPPSSAPANPRPGNANAAARNDEVSSWTTLDLAVAESKRNGKPVLIDFNADWCGPCQALKHDVFEDFDRGKVVQTAVIPVSIVDRRREEGANPPEIESLQERYQVDAFPTLIVWSPASGRTLKARGYRGADAMLAWIEQAAREVR